MNAFTITEKENTSEDIEQKIMMILAYLQNRLESVLVYRDFCNGIILMCDLKKCFFTFLAYINWKCLNQIHCADLNTNTCLFMCLSLAYLSANSAKIPTHVFLRQLTRVQYVKKFTLLNLTVSPLDSD